MQKADIQIALRLLKEEEVSPEDLALFDREIACNPGMVAVTRAAVQQTSPPIEKVLGYRYYAGGSHQQVASWTGQPVGDIKRLKAVGRRQVRATIIAILERLLETAA